MLSGRQTLNRVQMKIQEGLAEHGQKVSIRDEIPFGSGSDEPVAEGNNIAPDHLAPPPEK